MKKSIKPILLIALVAVLIVLVVVPAKSYAGVTNMPGVWGSGPHGLTCWCPILFYDCGCIIFEPEK